MNKWCVEGGDHTDLKRLALQSWGSRQFQERENEE